MTSRSRLILFSSMIAISIAAIGAAAAQQPDAAPDRAEAVSPDQTAPAAPQPDAPTRPPAKPRVKAAASKPATPKTRIQAQAAAPSAPSTPVAAPAPSAPPTQLPNGASSITESFGDWTVNCRIEGGQKYCVLSQAQGNKQTGQRTFAIELLTPKDGKADGTILMPFGLKLDAGAVLKLDDKDLGQGLRFSTCVPEGCLLPVSFPAIATDAMKKGTTLAVTGLNLSSGQAVTFSIALNGFPAALKRVADLGS
jgi:invasion protein IalB